MTPKEASSLHHFLIAFDAQTLGEGDAIAGSAVLAASAVTLANLAQPGSGIQTPEGLLLRVGCNLLASGSLTTNLILDGVVTPVGCCQANLLRQLRRLLKDDATEASRADRGLQRKWVLSDGPNANASEQALFGLMTSGTDNPPLIGSHEDEWARVVAAAPTERLEDLVQRPRSFIAAVTPDQLEQQLPSAHRGEALVALGLNRSGDAAKFGDLCPALMDGLIPGGPSGERVRARLLVTASARILREAATTSGDKTAWLARLVWLVEGGAGPELPSLPPQDGSITTLPHLAARFERAVQLLLGNRLNEHEPQPVLIEGDYSGSQARWMDFLREMESSLPDITGTARTLFCSLVFGLRQLVGAAEMPKDFKYYRAGIESFARFLIHRMASARSAMLFTAQEAWKLRLKRKILARLADRRLNNRSIYHPLHLPAAICEDLLAELEADSLVQRRGCEWERIEGTELPAMPTHHLALEV